MRQSWTPASLGFRARLLTVVLASGAALAVAAGATSARSGDLSAQSLAFGNVALGRSKTLPLIITNVGTQRIPAGGIVPAAFKGGPDKAAWSVVVGDCPPAPAGLAPGQSCSVPITFTPSKKGRHKTHLILQDDSGLLSVPLSGTGG